MRLVFSVLTVFSLNIFSSAFAADDDRFPLADTPRTLREKIEISDKVSVNHYLRRLVEEFEGKAENPDGVDSQHLSIALKDSRNACRKGKEISKSLTAYNCTVKYTADRWHGTMKAVLLIRNGYITQLVEAGFDGFH